MSVPDPWSYPPPGSSGSGAPSYGTQPPAPGYGPGYSAPGFVGPGPYGYQPRGTNGMAIASLICSLAGFLTCVSAVVGIILGHIALKQIKQSGEDGEGMAKAGLIVGYVLTGLSLLAVVGYVVFIVVMVGASSS